MKMRMTQVAQIEDLGPHMRRITLIGDDLKDFPPDQESAHFKAIFPQPGQTKPKLGIYAGFKKWMRSYTIRAFNQQTKVLTVDFAVNDHKGLGTDWANNAKVGDYLGIAGPGDTKYTNYDADWHLLVADLTGLPAAAAALEKLPKHAIGVAFLQVPTEQDKQLIHCPEGMKINWVINPDLTKNALLMAVENTSWLSGEPAIFIATESSQMKAIKKYVKNMPGYTNKQTYASGYWKA
ncbi:siderophore-interacting protein [Methylophaga sulfidovorans]|uniref:NADPH-dependent ferric siderophore reductase, contains FAD-binding and SIP domains n=1 Tax=Methylophaga sulfidovorans TaxID=45496 RepID=A0A1I4B8E9_9GAMM|nr:siderophore-interacting protein [Methylophaga sulfidovorans]SFK64206.1 NADPH-dependent ferric siderophore reductase, contains FAD-binding and SIP domains [Methylophaga sulfidovorans]